MKTKLYGNFAQKYLENKKNMHKNTLVCFNHNLVPLTINKKFFLECFCYFLLILFGSNHEEKVFTEQNEKNILEF